MVTVAVDSHYSIDRAGLAALVESLPGLRPVPRDSNPAPQVHLWDIGGEALDRLPPISTGTALLVLVSDWVPKSLPPGIAGLFSKEETPEALGVAIRQVARGEAYLSPALAIAILRPKLESDSSTGVDAATSVRQVLESLSEREREALSLLAEGLSNKAIAARLYLSVRTVEGHLAKLYARLGVHSRTEAMRIAMQHKSVFDK